jgi:prepilin-type N-terminal cleavage/methylation domain-containing protein
MGPGRHWTRGRVAGSIPLPRRAGTAKADGRVRDGRSGFSLIEVIVALLVLTVGLLGLAAGTGWMIRTVHYGELETKRGAALQSAVELVRSTPFDELGDGEEAFGDYMVRWTLGPGTVRSRQVEFVVVGPGRAPTTGGGMPAVSPEVADTLTYRVLRRD